MRRAALVLTVLLLTGCPSPQQIDESSQQAATLTHRVDAIRAELLTADPVHKAALEAELASIGADLKTLRGKINAAEGAWDWAEILTAGVAAFFPPAGLAALAIRRARNWRRSLGTVFDSVEAAGGPANPDVAKPILAADPLAHRAYVAWKASNGA